MTLRTSYCFSRGHADRTAWFVLLRTGKGSGVFKRPATAALLWIGIILTLGSVCRLGAIDLYVAPNGSDAGAGSIGSPFATLGRARDAMRALRNPAGPSSGGGTIWLRGGDYNLTSTVVFDHRDSGTPENPIVLASYIGEEARISGGPKLDPSWFALVDSASPAWFRLDPAAKGKICSTNLRAHGVVDFGTFSTRDYLHPQIAPLELFFNGHPMTLARWPNRKDPLARADRVISGTGTVSSTQVNYRDTRPERWTHATDIWAHGLWVYPWADDHLKVSAVNPASHLLTLATAPTLGLANNLSYNSPYYVYNLLEELDEPGEYYLDRATGILYFWPPASLAGASIQVTTLGAALLQIDGSQYLSFRDLVIEAGRSHLIQIDSGDHNRIERCLLRNAGEAGAVVSGTNNGLDQCEIADCGEESVILLGGDRLALTSGGNFVTNCRIHRNGRIGWTNHPGVQLELGCGNVVAHNLIDELPHQAIIIKGNNHIIEYNEIRRVCQITSDAGAIYSGANWGFRGNVVRYNFIHHIQTSQPDGGVNGVYLDDCVSGFEVYSNILYRIQNTAIACGGGRDTKIHNNLVGWCAIVHHNDNRGRAWISSGANGRLSVLGQLLSVNYQKKPWSDAYPSCARIPNSWAGIMDGLWRNPQNCTFDSNSGFENHKWMEEGNWTKEPEPLGGVFSAYSSIANNAEGDASWRFSESACFDRSQRADWLTATVLGFTPVPFSAIGRSSGGAYLASQAPPSPALTGKATSESEIDLQWSDDGNVARNQEANFSVECRKLPGGAWQTIQSVGPDTNEVFISGLTPASNFAFRVRATNNAGSSFSNESLIETNTASPAAPTNAKTIFLKSEETAQ